MFFAALDFVSGSLINPYGAKGLNLNATLSMFQSLLSFTVIICIDATKCNIERGGLLITFLLAPYVLVVPLRLFGVYYGRNQTVSHITNNKQLQLQIDKIKRYYLPIHNRKFTNLCNFCVIALWDIKDSIVKK